MKESFVPKYYSLDAIPSYRSQYIGLRLKWFIQIFGLNRSSWPLNPVKLLNMMKESSIINFNYGLFRLPQKYDAITEYISKHQVYLMEINANKVHYPFETSGDRRVNFTICHEIAHIILGHLLVPRSLKTARELALEEAEADEFAARLLMPEKLLYSCNYYSLDKAAEYFNVSKAALWKRLNNIKRLDLLSSRKTPSCPKCGNTRFLPFGEFCPICGQARDNLKGMFTACYNEGVAMDKYKRTRTCPRCGSALGPGVYDKCSLCGLYIFNFCTSHLNLEEEECSFANLGSSRFCEMCGRPTLYFKLGLLKPWEEEFQSL